MGAGVSTSSPSATTPAAEATLDVTGHCQDTQQPERCRDVGRGAAFPPALCNRKTGLIWIYKVKMSSFIYILAPSVNYLSLFLATILMFCFFT